MAKRRSKFSKTFTLSKYQTVRGFLAGYLDVDEQPLFRERSAMCKVWPNTLLVQPESMVDARWQWRLHGEREDWLFLRPPAEPGEPDTDVRMRGVRDGKEFCGAFGAFHTDGRTIIADSRGARVDPCKNFWRMRHAPQEFVMERATYPVVPDRVPVRYVGGYYLTEFLLPQFQPAKPGRAAKAPESSVAVGSRAVLDSGYHNDQAKFNIYAGRCQSGETGFSQGRMILIKPDDPERANSHSARLMGNGFMREEDAPRLIQANGEVFNQVDGKRRPAAEPPGYYCGLWHGWTPCGRFMVMEELTTYSNGFAEIPHAPQRLTVRNGGRDVPPELKWMGGEYAGSLCLAEIRFVDET